ncbi:PAS domain-containing protein [Pseudothauera nasutitermitis]|uniref:histidine kinase n=1 Tax=Pseudothauera nasutitermitis TaxID=2565930 RepID=A0A4S4AZT4_9RHOO|nr:ATP-binding protein [Pseudothauera nasutitermitis]THF65708.1 PAS domain-containing protein [Pseudothauera nasutitermitis]
MSPQTAATATDADARNAAVAGAARLDAAQLAEAFQAFSRASEELSQAYNGLQGRVEQLTERLTVLMGALPAGVVVLDRAGNLVQVNRAAENLLGAGITGRNWREVGSALEATETPGEQRIELADGTRRLSVSETPLESGDERILLLHDITETYRMRIAAERNERLAAMGEMVAGLAHQLRTPLSAALLYTGNLRQPELGPAERTKVADRAIERLRYLERLIRDMLAFARGDCVGRQHFGVCELAAELTHTLEPVARARRIEFSSACECGELTLFGDRKALGGAITNLLENAIQATEPGGAVRCHVAQRGEEVVFTVADNGRGIDPAVQERLFDPFFTTRAEGTGLGLAIARGVARAHGGEIALESTPGQGSTFTLTLPLPRADAETADKASA